MNSAHPTPEPRQGLLPALLLRRTWPCMLLSGHSRQRQLACLQLITVITTIPQARSVYAQLAGPSFHPWLFDLGWRICVLLTEYLTHPEESCRCHFSHLGFFRREGVNLFSRCHQPTSLTTHDRPAPLIFSLPPNCRKSAYLLPQRRVRMAQLRLRSQWREAAQAGQQMTCRLCTQLC